MSKFLALFIQMLLIVLIYNIFNIDCIKLNHNNYNNNKTDRNYTKMLKLNVINNNKRQLKLNLMNDITSLFKRDELEMGNYKRKRYANRIMKLMENKHKIQQLLKVKKFLDSLDRHVRSARLRHYAEYIRNSNETNRKKKSVNNMCVDGSCNASNNSSTVKIKNVIKSSTTTSKSTQSTTTPVITLQNLQQLLSYKPLNWIQPSRYTDLQNPNALINKYVPFVPMNQPQNYYVNRQQNMEQIPMMNQQMPLYPQYNYGNLPQEMPEAQPQNNYPINTKYISPIDMPIIDDDLYKPILNIRETKNNLLNCDDIKSVANKDNAALYGIVSSSPIQANIGNINSNITSNVASITTNNDTNPLNISVVTSNSDKLSSAITQNPLNITTITSNNFTTLAKENVTALNNNTINDGGNSATTNHDSVESIMKKVLQDVEELKTGKAGMMKEDLPCEINGRWFSTAGGLILQLCPDNQTNVRVITLDGTPKSKQGFMLQDKYQFDGILPFPRSGMILINGISQEHKNVATFIGQCLICNGAETIVGQWLTTRKAKNCIDLKASQEIFGDVLTKENLSQTRNKRFELHANDTNDDD